MTNRNRRSLFAVLGVGILALALVGCPVGDSPLVEPPLDLVIANVTLVDGTGGPARPGVHVAIRDGRIAGIVEGESGAIEAGEILDGTGKFLIPGLIDGHAHPFPEEETFPQFVHYGVTSIFIPGCGECSDEHMTRVRAMSEDLDTAAPRVFHTSQHFTMEGRHPVKTYQSPKWVEGETVFYVRDLEQIPALVERVAEQPILGIKVTIEEGPEPPFVERIPVDFVSKIVEEAHRRDLKVYAHVSDMEEVRMADQAGADHLLHFVGVDIDWGQDRETINRLRDRDVSWVTTLMIDKSFFYPARPDWFDTIRAEGVFDTEQIGALQASTTVEESLARLSGIYSLADPTLAGILAPQMEDLRQLHDLGIDLVIGTDVGNDFIFPGYSLHEEMEMMAQEFEPGEILVMATRNGAELIGAEDSLGTLEVGKIADMILLDRDPLEEIRNLRSIVAVFRGGVRQDRLE